MHPIAELCWIIGQMHCMAQAASYANYWHRKIVETFLARITSVIVSLILLFSCFRLAADCAAILNHRIGETSVYHVRGSC